MTLSQLISWMKLNGQKLPNIYGGVPSTNECVALLNQALERAARLVRMYDPVVQLTLQASEPKYNLFDPTVVSKRVLQPDAVYIDGSAINGRAYYGTTSGVLSIPQLERVCPNWRALPAGQPIYPVWENSNTLRLVPAPNGSVAAGGPHYISGIVVPGVIGVDGYLPQGFTENTTVVSGGTVTETVSARPATVSDLYSSGHLTGSASDISADDSNYIQISQAWPLVDDSPLVAAYGFDFSAIPAGATINWVKIDSCLVASPDSGNNKGDWIIQVVDDASSSSPSTVYGSLTAEPVSGATYYEAGPTGMIYGVTREILATGLFGLQMTQSVYQTGSPHTSIGGTYVSRMDYISVTVSYTFTSTGSTTTTIDETAKPDLPDDVHADLAILALIIGANPVLSEREQLQIFQNVAPGAVDRLMAIGRSNDDARDNPAVIFGAGETGLDSFLDGYWPGYWGY